MNTLRLFLVPILGAVTLLIPLIGVFLYIIILCGWYNRNQKNIHAFLLGQDEPVGNNNLNGVPFGYLKEDESIKDLT
ncbi:MAG: hypothetical protein WBF38_01295 [Nitrosotalea sp.]